MRNPFKPEPPHLPGFGFMFTVGCLAIAVAAGVAVATVEWWLVWLLK